MLKIGDFSKFSQVSVKTLRYYDEVGLLSPQQVDAFTGYRYYSASQLPRLNRILALKDLGFSLEQIAQVLSEGVSTAQLQGMLRLKRAEIQQRLEAEQDRLARVEARLKQIEAEDSMPNYEVILKTVPPLRVAAIREVIPTYSQQGHLWQELYAHLARNNIKFTGPCLTIYYDTEYRERDVDAEVCQPIEAAPAAGERIAVRDLPEVAAMACAVHHGPYAEFNQAYAALMQWIDANGYRIVGPAREVYLQAAGDGDQANPNNVTEVQFPVEKA